MPFIVFEGIDGSGKTTQQRLLHDYLGPESGAVIEYKFPVLECEYTGDLIDRYLKGNVKHISEYTMQELLLYNIWRHSNSINNLMLGEDNWAIVDRFLDSWQAYSNIKQMEQDPLDSFTDARFPTPDLIIYLKVTPIKAHIRLSLRDYRKKKRIYDSIVMLEKISVEFDKICNSYKHVIIDGDQAEDKVFRDIVKALKDRGFIDI